MKKLRGLSMVAVILLIMLLLVACNTESKRSDHKKPVESSAEYRPVQTKTGEELFKQFCATCHPDGSNVSDPQRNLRRTTLQDNHITNPEDIIRIMRHPISRMITFDSSTISDQDARVLAEYVLAAF